MLYFCVGCINKCNILIILLIIPKITHALFEVSDLVQPKEFCANKQECLNIGFTGHIECINNMCSCINKSKYMKNNYNYINGCFWNITIGNPCIFNKDCADDGSICTGNRSGCNESNEKNIKTCQCPSNKEYVDGRCQKVIPRIFGSKCCSNNDCNANFECYLDPNYPFGHCKCATGYAFYMDQCISLKEAKICSQDADCSEDFFCIKLSSELHGTCREINMITPRVQCKESLDCNRLGFLGHVECQNDYCFCSNRSKQIHLDSAQGCYMTSNYGQQCLYRNDCQNNLECIHYDGAHIGYCQCPNNMIHYQNNCVPMPENKFGTFCQNNNECNATGLFCQKIPGSSLGRCECYNQLVFDNKCIEFKEFGLCNANNDCPSNEICKKTAYTTSFGNCVLVEPLEINKCDSRISIDEPKTASVHINLVLCISIVSVIIVIVVVIVICIKIHNKTGGYFVRRRTITVNNSSIEVMRDLEALTSAN